MTMPGHLYLPKQAPQHPGYARGLLYPTFRSLTDTSTAMFAVDTIFFYSFSLPATMAFSGATVYVATGGAGSSIKLGIWANSPLTSKPVGAPLFRDNAGVATTSSAAIANPAIGDGRLIANVVYWVGTKATGTLPVLYGYRGSDTWSAWLTGIVTPLGGAFRLADAYANNLPNIAEGQAFTSHGSTVPGLYLTAA